MENKEGLDSAGQKRDVKGQRKPKEYPEGRTNRTLMMLGLRGEMVSQNPAFHPALTAA